MKTSIFLWCFSLLFVQYVSAQEVIATQGDSYTSANAAWDFTVGEVVINTLTAGSSTLAQGFQQPYMQTVGIEDYQVNYLISLYPNPTKDAIVLATNDFVDVQYSLYDARGSLVMQNKLVDKESNIDVSHLPKGSYQLHLSRSGDMLKTYTLIKN